MDGVLHRKQRQLPTLTDRDLIAYTNRIVKDYVRKVLNKFQQMTAYSTSDSQ